MKTRPILLKKGSTRRKQQFKWLAGKRDRPLEAKDDDEAGI
jgi:hypothetical protein